MAIVQTIDSFGEFRAAFKACSREDNFTPTGLRVLYAYLDSLSEGTGEDYQLDVIELCCAYSESTVDEVISNYNLDVSDCEQDGDYGDTVETVRDYINDNTALIGETASTFLFVSF